MELELKKIAEKLKQNDFVENFINELSEALKNFSIQEKVKSKKIGEVRLTPEEDIKFYRKKWNFLENYFEKELSDLSKGEIFLVTNKYENDYEYHRYKVTQYVDGHERKYIAFEKDLPENVQLGDVVRKTNGKYIYDKQATQYIKKSLNEIKQRIINERN